MTQIQYYNEMTLKFVLRWFFFKSEMSKNKSKIQLFESKSQIKRCNFFQMKWKNNKDMTPTFSYIYIRGKNQLFSNLQKTST